MQTFIVDFFKTTGGLCPTIGNKIILTHGFVKKTQKTPKAEIVRAKKYRTDYLQRKELPNE